MNIYQYPPVQKGENKVEYIKDFLGGYYATKKTQFIQWWFQQVWG